MVAVDPRGVASAALIIRAAIAMEVSVSLCVVARLPQHAIFGATPFAVADAEKHTLANGPALRQTAMTHAVVRNSLAARLRPVHSVELSRCA